MKKIIEKTTFAGSRQRRQTKMIALSCVMSLLMFTVSSCNKFNNQISETINVSFTPCQQNELKSSSNISDNVNVEFTNNGVQITYSNFAVTCDFTNVNVTHTLVNGVLNITQAGTPNLANCICYTDVSYTINGILQNEVNVIFINGEQVYCYNDNYPVEIPFTEYSLENTSCQWTNLNYDDEIVIINSNVELQNYISCINNYPTIDFSEKTLLIASGINASGLSYSIAKKLLQLGNLSYELEVELQLNMLCVETPWQVAIIVDKINSASIVNLKISFDI